jgi:hypothetical protein
MKRVRTDCEGEKKKESWRVWKFLKIENLSRFFEKNSLKKLGQPSLKKKSYLPTTGCNLTNMKKVRTDCEGGKQKSHEGYENFENWKIIKVLWKK